MDFRSNPKLCPINRSTDLEVLRDKFDMLLLRTPQGDPISQVLTSLSTADPEKEPPLVTANTMLSILAVDYPVEKCRVTFLMMEEPFLSLKLWQKLLVSQTYGCPFVANIISNPKSRYYFSLKIDPTKNR
ncbi:Cellulose synthase-like protein D4 [Raphanus sativus]|nr:Cellulose synthase-like protein D4 [Raphanus sativus]